MKPKKPFRGSVVDEREFYFKYYTIAKEIGIDEATLYRWCNKAGVEFARWGRGKHSPIYLSRGHLSTLLWRFVLARVSSKLPFPTRVVALDIFPIPSSEGGKGESTKEEHGQPLRTT